MSGEFLVLENLDCWSSLPERHVFSLGSNRNPTFWDHLLRPGLAGLGDKPVSWAELIVRGKRTA